MSTNKLIEKMGIEPRTAEELRKRLREDRSDFARVMTAAVTAYMNLRDCGDFECHIGTAASRARH
jgi:hypothetical protein